MGMADPFSETITIKIVAVRTTDDQLTCFLCGRPACVYEFTHRSFGSKVTTGFHLTCAEVSKLV
jgi:hypothetical protein